LASYFVKTRKTTSPTRLQLEHLHIMLSTHNILSSNISLLPKQSSQSISTYPNYGTIMPHVQSGKFQPDKIP